MGAPADGDVRAVKEAGERAVGGVAAGACVVLLLRGEVDGDLLRALLFQSCRVDAYAGGDDHFIDDRGNVDGQIVDADGADAGSGLQDELPLEEAGILNAEVAACMAEGDRVPVAPGAGGIFYIAGARVQLDERWGGGLDLGAAPLGKDARVEDIADIAAVRRGTVAQAVELAGVGGGDVEAILRGGEAGGLRGVKVRDVFKLAALVNAIDVATVAAGGDEAVFAPMQSVDDVVVAAPEHAGRAAGGDLINLRAVRDERVAAGSLHGACRDNGDGRGDGAAGAAAGRQRGKRIFALAADACRVDGAVGRDREGGDFLFGRVVDHICLAALADAIDEAGAVRACDEVAVGREGEGADVRLVALVEERGLAAGRDLVNGSGSAGRDVKVTIRAEQEPRCTWDFP